MPNFKGFSTIGQYKKFILTDFDLIKRDLQNAFSIRQGSIPGRPKVGTNIWTYIHEPNDDITRTAIKNEVQRIIELDSRLKITTLAVTYEYNTVQIAVECLAYPQASVEKFFITFNTTSSSVKVL